MGIKELKKIKIKLATPEKVQEWSFGEVIKPETINYRTLNPEVNGLFCERIFGPIKDWECACGKYKRMRYKGLICEKCGVEVTRSKVRRERTGHIELAVPVSHIWYSSGRSNKMALLLGLSSRELESVLYFTRYIITEKGNTILKNRQVLNEREYKLYKKEYGDSFQAEMGAEAILKLLGKINLDDSYIMAEKELDKTKSKVKRKKIAQRLKVIKSFIESENKPKWMILKYIPVIPADLRPMVQLDGGRFATSDLNDLYRRIINRNNRVKRAIEIKAPGIVIKNEKKRLQESVDALIDNGRRGKAVVAQNNRRLKSLSGMIRGEQGSFKQNLLGKRVDYSGTAVVTIDPKLHINQCKIPKKIALELFKPFIMRGLVIKRVAPNIKEAKKLVEEGNDDILKAVESVMKDHPVLLSNKALSDKSSLQAFYPTLTNDFTIKISPISYKLLKSCWKEDSINIHLVLSPKSVEEAKTFMLSEKSFVEPIKNNQCIEIIEDVARGCFFATTIKSNLNKKLTFSNISQVNVAYECGRVKIDSPIMVRVYGDIVSSSVGRVLFNNILPKGLRNYSRLIDKEALRKILTDVYVEYGMSKTIEVNENIKRFGLFHLTKIGLTTSLEDINSNEQERLVPKKVVEVLKNYKSVRELKFIEAKEKKELLSITRMLMEKLENIKLNSRECHSKNRSILECELEEGICFSCYSESFKGGVKVDKNIGITSAQYIGKKLMELKSEPLKNGNVGGKPRSFLKGYLQVKELLDIKKPKYKAEMAMKSGEVKYKLDKRLLMVKTGSVEIEYPIHIGNEIMVEDGNHVEAGDRLTSGRIYLPELLMIMGKEFTSNYMLKRIIEIFSENKVNLEKGHFEMLVKQMFKKVKIIESGDSFRLEEEIEEESRLSFENKDLVNRGRIPIKYINIIDPVGVQHNEKQSFLLESALGNPSKVLVQAAIEGREDLLKGVRENIILGRGKNKF